MSELVRHAPWMLLITVALSFIYELYRATIKAGVSRHDSLRTFVSQGLPLYVVATIVIAAQNALNKVVAQSQMPRLRSDIETSSEKEGGDDRDC